MKIAAATMRELTGELDALRRERIEVLDALQAKARLLTEKDAQIKALADALGELRDLMEAVRAGEYKPDSFTVQPADAALRIAGRLP